MPYAPQTTYDASPLYQGLSTAGGALAAGLQRMQQNKMKSDSTDAALSAIIAEHPDLVKPEGAPDSAPGIDAATLEKFSKGSLGAKQGMLGELTAAVADKFKGNAQNIDVARVNVDAQRVGQEGSYQQRMARNAEDRIKFEQSGPKFIRNPQTGQGVMVNPDGSSVTPTTKVTLPEPGAGQPDAGWTTHMGADGKPIAKTRWNPYEGKTETVNLRERPDPMAEFNAMNGGAPAAGGSAGAPPSAGGGTVAPPPAAGGAAPAPAGAAPAAGQPPSYIPGKVYPGANGTRAMYNADGTWTKVGAGGAAGAFGAGS